MNTAVGNVTLREQKQEAARRAAAIEANLRELGV